MRVPRIAVCTFFSLIGIATCLASPPKVIIDTDFNTIGDDGQVAVMAAQLYAQGAIDLLGFTIPQEISGEIRRYPIVSRPLSDWALKIG